MVSHVGGEVDSQAYRDDEQNNQVDVQVKIPEL